MNGENKIKIRLCIINYNFTNYLCILFKHEASFVIIYLRKIGRYVIGNFCFIYNVSNFIFIPVPLMKIYLYLFWYIQLQYIV